MLVLDLVQRRLSVHANFDGPGHKVRRGLGFLHPVALHDLPFFRETQKPGAARLLLPVHSGRVDHIVVLENRLLEPTFWREHLRTVEPALAVHSDIEAALDALYGHHSQTHRNKVEQGAVGVLVLAAVDGSIRLHLQVEALLAEQSCHDAFQLWLVGNSGRLRSLSTETLQHMRSFLKEWPQNPH